jgi:N-acetylglucosaminyl-diphospho-decaprenol L-rhamnosyltransferase
MWKKREAATSREFRVMMPRTVLPSRVSAHTCRVATPASHRSPFALALSVIVVSADSGPTLRDCVRGVLASTLPLELILVDNNSHDGVPEAIERAHAHDTRLKVIYNYRNLGFGPAVNLAAKQAHGQALMILNPDCLLQQGDLQRLLALLSGQPRAGLIGAVVCDAEGRPDPASWRRDPLLQRSLNSLLGRPGEKINIEREIPSEVVEAEAVSGAVMLMPRAMFQRLDGFDEDYFLHCEDLDLCRRVRDLGYQVLLAGDVRVQHGKGSSSRHRPVFVSRHKHRGMWRWFRKHDPAARNPLTAGVVWLGIWAHFLLQIPGQLWRLPRKRGAQRATGSE